MMQCNLLRHFFFNCIPLSWGQYAICTSINFKEAGRLSQYTVYRAKSNLCISWAKMIFFFKMMGRGQVNMQNCFPRNIFPMFGYAISMSINNSVEHKTRIVRNSNSTFSFFIIRKNIFTKEDWIYHCLME